MTIVCGTDLTPRSESGVAAAGALASHLRDGAFVLVHVIEKGAPEVAARAQLGEQASRVAARFGIRADSGVEQGDPAAVLQAEAERSGALLVVSCAGHGKAPLRKVGGVAERIAEEARVPTLVVYDSAPFVDWAEGRRALKVVIGLSDDAAEGAAIEWLGKLRSAGPCDVAAVTIYDPAEALAKHGLARIGSLLDADARVEREIVAGMQKALAHLGGTGPLICRAVAGLGRRGDHLLEFASEREADLLIVGAHRKGWLARFSSVSSVALHWRRTSVACIPEPRR